jgi:hypothetical protein
MATWPSATKASTANLDSGTDSPASARADIKTNVDNVNSVIDMFNIVTPADNQILKYSSANTRFELATDSGGITDVVQDTTPQLGGNLDVNGNSIVSASNGNIAITPNGTGSVVLDGLNWPQADGSADQVLKTNGSGQLSFVTAGGGGNNIILISGNNSSGLFQWPGTTNTISVSDLVLRSTGGVAGVSVSGKTFTLPAGTYNLSTQGPVRTTATARAEYGIYNVTGDFNQRIWGNWSTWTLDGNTVYWYGVLSHYFTIEASTTFHFRTMASVVGGASNVLYGNQNGEEYFMWQIAKLA